MDHPVLPEMQKTNVEDVGDPKSWIWAKKDENWAF